MTLLLLIAPALAGERWLINDGYAENAEVGFQEGFVAGECWGSIYVPDEEEYPFTLKTVRMLVGGSAAQEYFTVTFYALPTDDMATGTSLGSEAAAIQGSNESWNDLDVADLKLGLGQINSGLV